MSRMAEDFTVSLPSARAIVDRFHEEMRRGLAGEQGSLKMLPSFVGRPRGTEMGRYLAIDLGGTNCRVLEVELDGRGGASVAAVSRFAVPGPIMRGPGAGLFDFLAGCVASFFREHPTEDRREQVLAFTFSFPVEQRSAASGTLIGWTKGFTATGVEGEDVVALLSGALERRGLGHLRIAALTNDTVGTLLAGSYADPSCDMGVILGTGTNACYPERSERIRNIAGAGFADEMIVNMEWGNFDRLETNRYDRMLDAASANPRRQCLEKMVSGMYLGEIARLALREMAEAGLLFPGAGGSAFLEPYSLATEQLVSPSRGGETSFAGIRPAGASAEDRAAVHEIGRLVAARSARIAGAAIAAVLTWMDPDLSARHAVAVDGSLFEGNPDYQAAITNTLRELCGERASGIRLVLARDGSGIGSAIAGAVAASADRDGTRAPETS